METTSSFGEWLKRRRMTLGQTQAALAAQVGVALVTIQKIEADARRPSGQVAGRLGAALQLPARLREPFLACARGQLAALRLPPPETLLSEAAPGALPSPVSSFIGRAADLVACQRLLAGGARLLTLVGPPGIGKTRLALALGHELAPQFSDGARFVGLAPISSPALVPGALARALGLTAQQSAPLADRLRDFVQQRELLLVLDNCEHLLDGVALLGDLLAAAPGMLVLATSRAPLRLSGEQLYAVEPLDELAALALFEARARAVRPDFALTDASQAAAMSIARYLDGLPLAIELAAARVRHLTPAALLARLAAGGLNELEGGARDAPARQQTVRDCIAWSYELLSASEQRAMRLLAVFAAGFTLTSASAVLRAEPHAAGALSHPLEALEALLEHSLLGPAHGAGGEPRYAMLELVREFALERLRESGDEAAARHAHAEHYVALAEQAAPRLIGPQADELMAQLDGDQPNFVAALDGCVADERMAALGWRLVAALGDLFWTIGSTERLVLPQIGALLAREPDDVPRDVQARVFGTAGWFEQNVGSRSLAEEYSWRALALAQQGGDVQIEGWIYNHLGHLFAQTRLDGGRARQLQLQALDCAERSGDLWGMGWALNALGDLALAEHPRDLQSADGALGRALECFERLGYAYGRLMAQHGLARLELERGQFDRAHAHLLDGLALSVARRDRTGMIGHYAWDLANLAMLRGDRDAAQAYASQSLAEFRKFGMPAAEGWARTSLAGIALAQGRYGAVRQLADATLAGQGNDDAPYLLWRAAYLRACAGVAEGAAAAGAWLREAAREAESLADPLLLAWCADAVAVWCARCDPARAAQLWGAARAAQLGLARPTWLWAPLPSDHAIAACRAALGDAAFQDAWEAGRSMSVDQALALALDATTSRERTA